jgi:hypothetical protein
MDYKITITTTEKKAMDTITNDTHEWIKNAVQNRARIAKEDIIAILVSHCNANDITLATGEEAQVQQAYDLKLVEAVSSEPPSPPSP